MNTKVSSMCMAMSLLIFATLGLMGCGVIEVGVVEPEPATVDGSADGADQVRGIEIGVEPTPMPEKRTYTNHFYGFKFSYPENWTLSEADHKVVLMKGTNRLGINYHWVNEAVQTDRTGVGAGDFIYADKISFLDRIIPADVLLFELKTKAVFYGETGRIEFDDLVFTIVLEDLETDYGDVDLSEEIMAEARQILESFERLEASGSPPEKLSTPEVDGPPPASRSVVAWLGHIASLPEGSQFDDRVVLSPEGTGEFGLTGATPEIEAEIHSLRDAEGPNEFVHLWGALSCGVGDYNSCQLSVESLQYGADYSEEDISDWFGTIKKSTFNEGESYVFELLSEFPIWYSINASQNEALSAQIEHFLETGEIVEVSGKLSVGVPDVNGTRIEISNIEARSATGMPRPDIVDGPTYENLEYGFSFRYPSYMSVADEPNQVLVEHDSLQLTIAYRRADENVTLAEIGELTNQLHPYAEVLFLGQFVQPFLNIKDGYIDAVYLGGPGTELGEGTPLRFVISLVNTEEMRLSNAQVDEMLQLLPSLELASEGA